MVFKNEEQIFKYITANKQTPVWITEARGYHKLLLALIDGEGFKELLIEQIEHLEDKNKAASRKKYSRNVTDFYERLLRLTDNIYNSTGGIKSYNNLSDSQMEDLGKHISNIGGGKSLESWLESTWLKTYHQDPNGIVFLEYDAMLGIEPRPTYKSINTIRNYVSNGQMLEVLLFEPLQLEDGNKQWVVVDDVTFYTINQSVKDTFTIVDEQTFNHEFGRVPAIINSDIQRIGYKEARLSPIHNVIELSEKFARDLSVKTVYQQLAGFPRRWSYASEGSSCPSCHGLGQNGADSCGTCGGSGQTNNKKDVTTEDILSIPENGEAAIVPASGYVSPDLAYLADSRIELKELEDLAAFTHWGSIINTQAVATATEVVINTQPVSMRLNKYANVAEYMESSITDLIANNMFLEKDKTSSVASIHYGRNYIIESVDAVLGRYNTARASGDNTIVLDRLYQEYLLSKYRSDETGLSIAIKKSKVDYYIHYTSEQIESLLNDKEVARKVLFNEWWKTIVDFNKSSDVLRGQYDAWFEVIYNKNVVVKETEVTEDN